MSFRKKLEAVSKLACVNRYSDHRLVFDESVLEHIGFTSLISFFIAYGLEKEGFEIEVGITVIKGIFHDLDEVKTGDISMPIKYFSEGLRKELKKMESECVYKIVKEDFEESDFVYYLWEEAKQDLSGKIISLCDTIAVLYKVHDEVVLRGNKTMTQISDGILTKINDGIVNILKCLGAKRAETLNDVWQTCLNMMYEIKES